MSQRRRLRLSERDFETVVDRAIATIPEAIREHLDNVVISVERRPSAALLEEMGLPPDEPLFGVFLGEPLTERSAMAPALYPATILIFQDPLERFCRSRGELETQIAITVVHEVAHFLGIDEQRLIALGYG
jgi:predicted Zn-dependent protease with MMP-like domain